MRNSLFIALLALAPLYARAQSRPVNAPITNPEWKFSVVGEMFSKDRELLKSSKEARPARDLVLGSTLLAELDRISPDFLTQAESLWRDANDADKEKIAAVINDKINLALLSLSLAHGLDQQAKNYGISLDPSEERVQYALQSVLLQVAVEGPLAMNSDAFLKLSNEEQFKALQKSVRLLREQADTRGESYLELRLDQNWNMPNLGRFTDESASESRSRMDWPSLAFEFRCAKYGENWTGCFPASVSLLRESLRKQLRSAFRAVLRKELFASLMAQDTPNLQDKIEFTLPFEFSEMYEKIKFAMFRVQEIKSRIAVLSSANGVAITSQGLDKFMAIFAALKSKSGSNADIGEALNAAVRQTAAELQFPLHIAFKEFSGNLQELSSRTSVSEAEAFALSAPQLSCNGRFSMLPCQSSQAKTEAFIMIDRKIRPGDQVLPQSHPFVREQVVLAVQSEKLRNAQIRSATRIIGGGDFVFAQDLSRSSRAEMNPWPKTRPHDILRNKDLFKDISDWTLALRFMEEAP